MKAIHLISFVWSLFITTLVPVSNAFTSSFLCDEIPCVDNVTTTTCEDLVLEFNFITDGCCFSLSDNGSGGCLISIEGDTSLGACGRSARVEQFSVGENVGEVSGLAGELLQYTISDGTLPDECPPSDYPVETASISSMIPTVSMRLEGIGNEWTEQDTSDWIALAEAHTVDFFTANPEYGFRDVLTYIQVYPNGGAVGDLASGKATLTYLQFVSFRINPDDINLTNSTVSDLLDIAFTSPAGSSMFLTALQGGSNPTISAVTDFSFSLTGDFPAGVGEATSRPGTDNASSAAGVFKWGWNLFVALALLTVLSLAI
jgi:hypothetical protein